MLPSKKLPFANQKKLLNPTALTLKLNMRIFQKIAFLFLLFLSLASKGGDTVFLRTNDLQKAGMDIAPHTSTFSNTSGTLLHIDEVQEKQFSPLTNIPDRHSQQPLIDRWLRTTLVNTDFKDSQPVVFYVNAHDVVYFYRDGKLVKTGGVSANKVSGHQRFSLALTLAPHDTATIYVQIVEKIRYLMPVDSKLYSPENFYRFIVQQREDERWLRFLLPLVAGILLTVTILGTYQYFLTHDKTFLFYALYAGSSFLYSFYGLEIRLDLALLLNSTRDFIGSIVVPLIIIFYSFFIISLLHIRKQFPFIWKALQLLLWITAAQALLSLLEFFMQDFLFSHLTFYYIHLSGIPAILINLLLIVAILKSKSPLKNYILAGLSSLLILFFIPSIFGFSKFLNMPYSLAAILHYGPLLYTIGLSVEAICFVLALAKRTKLITEDNIQKERAFGQRLAETEMAALRAQINPHFIFNCLNSIKLYTLENDSVTATNYLSKFSQLIRSVLENSRTERVLLKKELDTLKLYIELEAMRFKQKLQYEFIIAEDIDAGFIEVPPMLIQPYVENAIWHGLMHKKEGGIIRVIVTHPLPELLKIEISDNGIGRKLATEYNSKSAVKHKSFGLAMSAERLATINRMNKTDTSIAVIDMFDDKHEPAGTKVIIEIPLQHA